MKAYSTVWILVAISLANAVFTITRVRHYRLFEANIDRMPETPSAKRVKVQSEPTSSSPLRFLSNIMPTETAESRAHADRKNDVWELSVWDPLPACLRLFCLFSPGHVLVYMLFLPVAPLDQRPSVTVFNCLVLQAILSTQLLFLQSRFSQQVKDTSIIHREVLHEYDTKFVHPRLHPVVRDAGTQVDTETETVTLDAVTGTPTTQIKRGFQTHPNPNYRRHVTPEGVHTNVLSPRLFSPAPQASNPQTFKTMQQQVMRTPAERLSLAESSMSPAPAGRGTPTPAQRQSLPPSRMTPGPAASPAPRQSLPPSRMTPGPVAASPAPAGRSTGTNFGGSMGIYTHVNSPLKKAQSMGAMGGDVTRSPRNSREMAALEQRRLAQDMTSTRDQERWRASSGIGGGGGARGELGSSRHGAGRGFGPDRYPSRWAYE